MLGPARKDAPCPLSQALGTFHLGALLYYSIIFRSQLKVGGQVGPGDKGQSELRRSCFHCFICEFIAPSPPNFLVNY